MIFAVLMLALAGSATGMILLDDSWLQLLLAGGLGLNLYPVRIPRARGLSPADLRIRPGERPQRAGARVVGGRHQLQLVDEQAQPTSREPDKIGKDPDIEADTVSFLEENAATRKGALAWITRRQGYLFFPLLLLEGLNLHVKSIRSLSARTPV